MCKRNKAKLTEVKVHGAWKNTGGTVIKGISGLLKNFFIEDSVVEVRFVFNVE